MCQDKIGNDHYDEDLNWKYTLYTKGMCKVCKHAWYVALEYSNIAKGKEGCWVKNREIHCEICKTVGIVSFGLMLHLLLFDRSSCCVFCSLNSLVLQSAILLATIKQMIAMLCQNQTKLQQNRHVLLCMWLNVIQHV